VAVKILPHHLSDVDAENLAGTAIVDGCDLQRYLQFTTYPESVSTPLVMVMNWTAELKEVKTLLDAISLQFAKFATQGIGWCVNLATGVDNSCN
jgi:hypothetical protein